MAELILQDQEGRCATCEFDGHILGCGSFGFIRKLSSSHGPIDPSHDAFNGKTVLKTLSHQFNEEHFVHLQRLTTLSHPNLVRCLMVGYPVNPSLLVPKLIHIILEYCEGGNLHQLAIKEPHKMTEKYILHLAEQIAKGIRYLHTRDPIIVYGDLKGENILFQDTAFMQVKIADLDSFGMFKGSQTLHGLMKNPAGSPTHMSPEMLTICDKLNSLSNMDERVGRRTDMYSFACLILELINKGQVPYTNPNKLSIAQEELSSLQAIRNVINEGGCPDVSILFSAPNALRYSRELQALLNQCLHWDPAERPDCHDLLARISYLRTGFFRSPHVLGIDFGESKISAAIYDGKVFRTIRNSIGGNNLAACVFFLEKDDSLTGLDAIRHADLWPSGYASRFKSCLLLDNPREFNKFIREKEPHYSTENSPAFTLTAMDGTKIVKRPAELLILLFKKIRRLAKDFLGPEPSCIVTYPDTWNAESRNKIAECLRVAGFEKCSFITDFKAILLGYYMKTMPSTTVDVNIIVDVGYEDCRVSLHTVSRGEDTFSTTKAKLPYGGRAIDMGLLKFCGDDFMRTNKFDFRDNPEAVLRVLLACEAAKIQLATSRSVTVSVKQVLHGKDLECVVSVEDFRKICGPIAAKITDAIRSRAKEYEKGKYALLLVGGGSRVPIIRELMNFFFGDHVNTSVQFYADEAAVLGAAGQAAAFFRNISESSIRVTAEVLSRKEQLPENYGAGIQDHNVKQQSSMTGSGLAAGLVRNQHDQLGDRNQVNEHSNYSDDEKNDRIVDFVQTCNRDNSDSNYMCSSENLATPSTEEDKSGSTSSFNTPVGESGFHSHDDTDGKQNVKKEFHTRRDVDVEIPPLEEKDRSKTRQEGDEFPDTLVDRAEISPSQKKPSHRTSEQYCRKISEGSCVSSNLTVNLRPSSRLLEWKYQKLRVSSHSAACDTGATKLLYDSQSQHRGGSGREETSSACSGKRDHYTKQQFAMTGNDLATDSFRTPGDPLEDHNKANEHCHYSGDEKNRRHQEPNKMISQTSSNHMHSLENLTTQSTEKDKAGTISSFNTPGGENVFHSQDNRSGKQNVEMESHTRQDMDVVMSPVEKKDYNKTRREGDGFSNTTVDRVEKPSRPTSEQDYRNESEGSCVPPNLMIPGLGSEQQGSHPNPSVHDSVDDDDQVTASYEHGVPQAQKPKTWWGTLKSFYG